MIECGNCKMMYQDDKNTEMCESEEAKEYFQTLNPEMQIIPYCEDFNRNRDCQFIKLNFRGLASKISL